MTLEEAQERIAELEAERGHYRRELGLDLEATDVALIKVGLGITPSQARIVLALYQRAPRPISKQVLLDAAYGGRDFDTLPKDPRRVDLQDQEASRPRRGLDHMGPSVFADARGRRNSARGAGACDGCMNAPLRPALRYMGGKFRLAPRIIPHFPPHATPDSLIYCDPPYVHDTRSQKRIHGALEHAYRHEMSDADHAELLDVLVACDAMVAVSGYSHPLYETRLADWTRVEFAARADGGRPRLEVLWLNRAAENARGGRLQFAGVAA